MDFWVQAVPPQEYERFLQGQPIGTAAGAAA
jgi:cytochrome c oxidase subunit 2